MQITGNLPSNVKFVCNICDHENEILTSSFHRETAACHICGSVPRFRGVINAVSIAIFGKSLSLKEFPSQKSIKAIGMSDSPIYAGGLEAAFSYTNTYFHTEPFCDVTQDNLRYQDLDLIVCSDVLEHVAAPIDRAFVNLHRSLRSGGELVMSVPYSEAPTTTEHYGNNASELKVLEFSPNEWLVLQRRTDRDWEVHEQPIFHGGPGTTLEMRVFGASHLMKLLADAGFHSIKIYDKPVLNIGYYWPPLRERDEDIGHPILGYIISAKA